MSVWTEISHLNEGSPNASNFTSSAISTIGANLIVIAKCTYPPGAIIIAPTDNQGNIYLTAYVGGVVVSGINIYYCINPITSATHTFTTTDLGGGYPVLQVFAFDGPTNPVFDQANGDNTTGTTPAIMPTANDELIFSSAGAINNNTGTLTCTNLTLTEYGLPFSPGAHMTGSSGYYEQTSATSVFATWAAVSSGDLPTGIVSFKGSVVPSSKFLASWE